MSLTERRVFVVVIDALGVGALPDAADYSDRPTDNTMANIDRVATSLKLPTLERLGLGNIIPLSKVEANPNAIGSWGKMAEHSQGKDTTTGHWEMAGIYLETPFPTYPKGFPPEIINAFIEKTGCQQILGNIPASGTEIIESLGPKQIETGYPIVYTSADSVFQIAAHVDVVSLETLYHWCEVAREILRGEHQVSRVIARPYQGRPGAFDRIGGDRRDYAVTPPLTNTLQRVTESGGLSIAVGKIEDIFCGVGVTHSIHTRGNTHGLAVTEALLTRKQDLDALSLMQSPPSGYQHSDRQFIFVNLVDTDMKFGHRRDVEGYARALEEVDESLSRFIANMTDADLLMITGDHGCDPTAPGSDHTREYVPIILYSPAYQGKNLEIRQSFADIGQTTLDWLGFSGDGMPGISMLKGLSSRSLSNAI
ncbi:MAG: phosphopentomutase [Cyanobacteria bacterium]|nr:phosphopentomutase [Cyanobacteriota bacterium]